MKLLLRRSQKSGLMGKITFNLAVRAELTEAETENVQKYRLGDTLLYERSKIVDPGSGLLGAASRLAHKMTNLSVTVADLARGTNVDCKDIVEMLAIEEQIKQAAQVFSSVLSAAASFGGDVVLEIT